MKNLLWRLAALLVSWRPIATWLITRAQRTPYMHIEKNGRRYMSRWWLFNAYDNASRRAKWAWFPISIRVHHIQMPDDDAHPHDHPWDARTLVLRGWYIEERYGASPTVRNQGDTAEVGHGVFHRITEVSAGGVYTLFISGRHRGGWGYLVSGRKVPWREYLGIGER